MASSKKVERCSCDEARLYRKALLRIRTEAQAARVYIEKGYTMNADIALQEIVKSVSALRGVKSYS